jgi:hypothetical protein
MSRPRTPEARISARVIFCWGFTNYHQLPPRQYVPQLCRLYSAASLIPKLSARVRLVRVPRVVEKALIGALLMASIAWGFLYNFVLEDNPQPMQMQPSAHFIGGTVGRR